MKAKDKERRLKLREEKIEQQRLHQEERVRKALERAKAEPKKQVCIYTYNYHVDRYQSNGIRLISKSYYWVYINLAMKSD